MSPGGDDRIQQPARPGIPPPLPTGQPSREPELPGSGQQYRFSTPAPPTAPAPLSQQQNGQPEKQRTHPGLVARRVAGYAVLAIACVVTLVSVVNMLLAIASPDQPWGYDVGYALGVFLLAVPLFLVAWLILRRWRR